jgi:hypothetical protein
MINYKGKSFVYYDEKSKNYYMRLNRIIPKELKYAFLAEYSTRQKNILISYIIENSKSICENNSVEIFAKLL